MEETKLRHKLKKIIAQSKVAEAKANDYPKVQDLILPLPLALGEKKRQD
jgi:hypothetical protein